MLKEIIVLDYSIQPSSLDQILHNFRILSFESSTFIFILLQASTEAQVLSSLVYNVVKTVPLDHRMYMFDIDCCRKGCLCISASNNCQSEYLHSIKSESDSILFTSPSAMKENGIGDELHLWNTSFSKTTASTFGNQWIFNLQQSFFSKKSEENIETRRFLPIMGGR